MQIWASINIICILTIDFDVGDESDTSEGRNNHLDWFLLSPGPTHGFKDFVSEASSHEDLNFVVLFCKVAVFLAIVFEGLAKCFVVNGASVVGSSCESCRHSSHVCTFLFCCLGSCCCVRDMDLLLGQHGLLLLYRDL